MPQPTRYISRSSVTEIIRDPVKRQAVLSKLNLENLKPLPKARHNIQSDKCRTNPKKFGMAFEDFLKSYLYKINRKQVISFYGTDLSDMAIQQWNSRLRGYMHLGKSIHWHRRVSNETLYEVLRKNNYDMPNIKDRSYVSDKYTKTLINENIVALRMHLDIKRNVHTPRTLKTMLLLQKKWRKLNMIDWSEDINHLRKLIQIIPVNRLEAKHRCSMGRFMPDTLCTLDMLIDNTIIDVKTVSKYSLTGSFICQIFLYAILYEIGGIPYERERKPVTHISIYFARQGVLWKQKITDLINDDDRKVFIEWFKKTYMNVSLKPNPWTDLKNVMP